MPQPSPSPQPDGQGTTPAAGSHRDRDRTSRRLLAEQVILIHQQAPLLLVFSLVIVAFTHYILRQVSPPDVLAAWTLVLVLVILLRLADVIRFQRLSLYRRYRLANRWRWHYLVGAFVTGTLWGLASLWLMPASIEHQTFMMMVVGGIASTVTVAYSVLRFLGMLFVIPSLLPWSLAFLTMRDDIHQVIGILALSYVAILSLASEYMHRIMSNRLQIAERNRDLMNALRRRELQTRNLNQKLQRENNERRQAEERFRRLADASDEGILIHDQGFIVSANRRVAEMFGYTLEELYGMNVLELAVPEMHAQIREQLMIRGERRLYGQGLRKDGTRFPLATHGKDIPVGETSMRVAVIQDLTALQQTEAALNREKERALVTLESIGDGVITTDAHGVITYLNPVCEELTGWFRAEAIGLPLSRILRLTRESSGEVVSDPVAQCVTRESRCYISGDVVLQGTRSHQKYCIEVVVSPVHEDERLVGTVLVLHDVTMLHTMAQQMSYQATHDALTGLINRMEFENRLTALLEDARRFDRQHVMCYLDLDDFKVVNDTSGHAAGDRMLQELSLRLETRLQEGDTLARLGGDEFGVLLQNASLSWARRVAEQLRQTVREYHLQWGNQIHQVGVSIGLVPIDARSGEPSDILSAADSACYVAKDRGRNQVHVYESDDAELARHHGSMRWLQKIRQALSQNRFRLYSQIITETGTTTGTSRHAEILLRMVSDEGELIAPGQFIPAAERYYLMNEIDHWVIRHALAALRSANHRGEAEALRVSINLSGQSLSDPQFLNFLVGALSDSGLPPQWFCFEITETAAVANIVQAQRFIQVLRGMGCTFALDDFGSGLSSFAYLKRLPVDYLKIDGSFVRNIVHDETDYAMVKSIQQIGNVMAIRTVAEFVENMAIAERLQELGVDYLQGYALGKPRPLGEFLAGEAGMS